MPAEKALALVLRCTDWSETSRIATLWTREFGKVRVLAKGGRRLKSPFESALDLLTVCRIVLLRKSSGGLDLLTEARVVQRFPGLTRHLPSLYAAYYVAELLDAGTEENDPHPALFDHALATLEELGGTETRTDAVRAGHRLLRFEMQWLEELGYHPILDRCTGCSGALTEPLGFSVEAGGLFCRDCLPRQRDRTAISTEAVQCLQRLATVDDTWRNEPLSARTEAELRRLLGQYVTFRLGRRPRMLPYLQQTIEGPEKRS